MGQERIDNEPIGFNPQKMGALETSRFKNLSKGDMAKAFEDQLKMYKEQWKLPDHVAAGAIHFIESSNAFVGIGKEIEGTRNLLILSHYSLITRDSGLKFDPISASEAYLNAVKKQSEKSPIPIHETAKLFSIIYSVDPDNETLLDAMELRDSAFLKLRSKNFDRSSEEDWGKFQGYLTDYYRYLDLAIRH